MQFDVIKYIIYTIMKQTFKALLISMFAAISLLAFDIHAQEKSHSNFEGTWILDSVQVKEVMSGNIEEKTVLPGGYSKFNNNWMFQFTLNADGKASYTEADKRTISDIQYTINNKNGNSATLNIDGVPDYKILNAQLLSNNIMLFTISFSSGYELKDIEVFWKMYYHKSN